MQQRPCPGEKGVGEATVFASHAWTFVFEELLASLRLFEQQQVRKMPRWPRSWANCSRLSLHSHRRAWANLHVLGQPNSFLASAPAGRYQTGGMGSSTPLGGGASRAETRSPARAAPFRSVCLRIHALIFILVLVTHVHTTYVQCMQTLSL